MPGTYIFDRQAVINAMHHRYVRERTPVRDSHGAPIYIDLLSVRASSVPETASSRFLDAAYGEYNMAVRNAALSDQDFDTYFIEELAHRLDRFAGEQSLESPCTPGDLGVS